MAWPQEIVKFSRKRTNPVFAWSYQKQNVSSKDISSTLILLEWPLKPAAMERPQKASMS